MGGVKEIQRRNRAIIEKCASDPKCMQLYVNFARTYSSQFVRRRIDPEDVVQVVFLRLLELDKPLDPDPKRFNSYVTQSIVNKYRDTYVAQSRRHTQPFDEVIENALTVVQPQDDSLTDKVNGALRQEIADLPQRYQTLLVDHWLNNQTYDEIARRQGMPVGTVKNQIWRGKSILKQKLYRFVQQL